MKIGIYDPYLDDGGGGEKYMMTIAECLAKKHEVSVFWDNLTDLENLGKRFSLDLQGVTLKKNIFSAHVGFIERIFATKKYDAIIILSDGSIPYVSSKKIFLHFQQPIGQRLVLSWKNKLKLARVTGIFYNSQFTTSFNDKIFSSVSSTVIYPPVDLRAKNTAKENIILHVGRFRVVNGKNEDYKKQQIMVDTFKKMVKNGLKNWKLIIATSIQNEDDPKFKNMLQSGKGFPVEFIVNNNNKELWEVYNKAKIYWHASGFGEDLVKHPEYAEHFGISTVEAMGAGAVPVVINAGGQKEIIIESKNGFFWDTLEELEEKTLILMKDSSLWEKMSQQARERAKDFSKEKFNQAIENLVQQ